MRYFWQYHKGGHQSYYVCVCVCVCVRVCVWWWPSREAGVCAAAREPGGAGGGERGVPVPGPGGPASHRPLEEGGRGPIPGQVRDHVTRWPANQQTEIWPHVCWDSLEPDALFHKVYIHIQIEGV